MMGEDFCLLDGLDGLTLGVDVIIGDPIAVLLGDLYSSTTIYVD